MKGCSRWMCFTKLEMVNGKAPAQTQYDGSTNEQINASVYDSNVIRLEHNYEAANRY